MTAPAPGVEPHLRRRAPAEVILPLGFWNQVSEMLVRSCSSLKPRSSKAMADSAQGSRAKQPAEREEPS